MTIVNLKTDDQLLSNLLSEKEGTSFECKRAAVQPHKILESVVAFANEQGGNFVLGLADPEKFEGSSRLIGTSENPDNVSELLKLLDREIEPPLSVRAYDLPIINSKNQKDSLLILIIPKSRDIHSLKKGDTFVRKGRHNAKATASEIVRIKYEKGALHYEQEPSEFLDLSCIDQALLSRYKHEVGSDSIDDWQFLKDNGLVITVKGRPVLTNGAVLLFGNNPSVLLGKKCGIKISHYFGIKPSFSGDPNFVRRPFSIEGPLITQIQKTIDYFREIVSSSPPKLKGAGFRPSFLIPEWVFHEAVTNAVIHRNYSHENDIQVRIFDNRVEVESPGTFPGHINIVNIRNERFARNPLLLRTLSRFQSAPNLDIGEGVDRMFAVMKESNLYEPLYAPPHLRPHTVLVVLLNMQRIGYWETVSNFLSKKGRITNGMARRITGVSDTLKMSRLLSSWVEQGLLEKRADKGSKRSSFYVRPGTDVVPSLFSESIENKIGTQ